ncbi:MAG: hypothetical protein ACTSW4_01015 [Candidatus Ranarchaeia archaeon]
MKDSSLRDFLQQLSYDNHISLFGVADVEPWQSKPGRSPLSILPTAKAVIVLGEPTPRTANKWMPLRNILKTNYVHKQILSRAGYLVTRQLEERGYNAIMIQPADYADKPEVLEKDSSYGAIMAGDLSLKYAGVKAGLGVIGKSGMLLHPRYGPFLSLIAVVTDAPLPVDKPMDADFCGECTACIDTCYTGALGADGTYDPIVCQDDPKGKVRIAWLSYLVCPAPCRLNCPVGLGGPPNPGAKDHGADPFQHMPFDVFHKLPKKRKN